MDFGSVQKIDPSEVCEDCFSDWLAENIEVLGEQVMFDIDPESVEREVYTWDGALRVDLLCNATFPGSNESVPVVIENQMTNANDEHLSALIQYIVEFEAQGAVWIAAKADPSYMRVMEWLNNETSITAYLFTMEIVCEDDEHRVSQLVRRVGPDSAPLTSEGGESNESVPVVIENQMTDDNDRHLSRLIQHIAEFEAQSAVWIAAKADPGYMRVIEWLNNETSITAYLFTMEIVSEDGARPVPRLVPRVGPDSAPLTREGGGLSESDQRKIDWWKRVRRILARECEEFGLWSNNLRRWKEDTRSQSLREDMPVEFYISVYKGRSETGIYLSKDWGLSEYYFNRFSGMKNIFEQGFDQPLNWEHKRGHWYIYWDNPDSYGYAGDDPKRQAKEAKAIAGAMKKLIVAVNAAMSSIEPYHDS